MSLSDKLCIIITAEKPSWTLSLDENDSSLAACSLALNKYQIIINSQEVPGWFMQEYEPVLSSMDNKEMKRVFEKGELFFALSSSLSRISTFADYA